MRSRRVVARRARTAVGHVVGMEENIMVLLLLFVLCCCSYCSLQVLMMIEYYSNHSGL